MRALWHACFAADTRTCYATDTHSLSLNPHNNTGGRCDYYLPLRNEEALAQRGSIAGVKLRSVSNMAPRMKGRQPEPEPLQYCYWGMKHEGRFCLTTLTSKGSPSPRCCRETQPGSDTPGVLFPAGELGGGLRAPAGCCLTQFTASSCPSPSPISLLSLGHFTCKYILQMVPGVSMTSPGNRKKTHCLNLGVGAQQLSENHLIRSREPGVLSSRLRRS